MRRLSTTLSGEVDMVCGSRFLTADYHYPAPISRRTRIHIFAFVPSRIVNGRVSDPTSGFRLYNRRAIAYPPSALFLVPFCFVLLLLLHFSSAVSRLGEQTKVLAQRLALLEERLQRQEAPRHSAQHSVRRPEDEARELAHLRRD